jgi:hypothetical protein
MAVETRSPSVTPPPTRVPTPSLHDGVVPQPKLDLEADLEQARGLPGGLAPERAIEEQIADLERWALANLRGDRKEATRFWVLRGVQFIGVIASGVCGVLALPRVAVACALLAALAVAIDAAWTGVALRSVHRRAVHDLRELQNTVKLKWDKVRLAYPESNATRRIAHALALLDAIQAKREEIGKYLGASQPSPGVNRPLS